VKADFLVLRICTRKFVKKIDNLKRTKMHFSIGDKIKNVLGKGQGYISLDTTCGKFVSFNILKSTKTTLFGDQFFWVGT